MLNMYRIYSTHEGGAVHTTEPGVNEPRHVMGLVHLAHVRFSNKIRTNEPRFTEPNHPGRSFIQVLTEVDVP